MLGAADLGHLGLGQDCTIGTTNVTDVPPCPVLLDLFVAGLDKVGSNSDDFLFRRGVLATFCGRLFVDLHLLFLGHVVVGRGSMDIETAQPVQNYMLKASQTS